MGTVVGLDGGDGSGGAGGPSEQRSGDGVSAAGDRWHDSNGHGAAFLVVPRPRQAGRATSPTRARSARDSAWPKPRVLSVSWLRHRRPQWRTDGADQPAGGIGQSPTAPSLQPRQEPCAAPYRLRIARRGLRRDHRGVVVPASELDTVTRHECNGWVMSLRCLTFLYEPLIDVGEGSSQLAVMSDRSRGTCRWPSWLRMRFRHQSVGHGKPKRKVRVA
jgi:hypothetical protein